MGQGRRTAFRLNFRNLEDRRRGRASGFLDGLNVGDEYLGKDPKLTSWRDTHGEQARPDREKPSRFPSPRIGDGRPGSCSTNSTGKSVPAMSRERWRPSASRPVPPIPSRPVPWDSSPDRWCPGPDLARHPLLFVPDDKIVTALQLAAMRGVDVRVVLPELSDSRLVYLSSFSYLKELEDAGVKFYRFQKGFLHQKVMIVDDSISPSDRRTWTTAPSA